MGNDGFSWGHLSLGTQALCVTSCVTWSLGTAYFGVSLTFFWPSHLPSRAHHVPYLLGGAWGSVLLKPMEPPGTVGCARSILPPLLQGDWLLPFSALQVLPGPGVTTHPSPPSLAYRKRAQQHIQLSASFVWGRGLMLSRPSGAF